MLENNSHIIAIIALFTCYCVVTLLHFMHKRVLKSYKALLDIKERDCLNLEQKFQSLLRDKKLEASRRKEAERLVRKAVEEVNNLELTLAKSSEFKNEVDLPPILALNKCQVSLNNCRAALELVGRVGTLTNDFWRQYCLKVYVDVVNAYIKSITPKIIELLNEHLKNNNQNMDEKLVAESLLGVARVEKALNNICTNITKTSIIPNLVDEMFLMADSYFGKREEYFISGGPVPVAVIDEDFVKGKVFGKQIKNILKKENLSDEQLRIIEEHISNVLIYPLSLMLKQINSGNMENLLSDTGYLIMDLCIEGSENLHNFTIPTSSRRQLEKMVSQYYNLNFKKILN